MTEGRKMVTSLLGIGGTAEGSQRHVTKMEICKSREELDATVLAMSMSMGENHSMHAEVKVKVGIRATYEESIDEGSRTK